MQAPDTSSNPSAARLEAILRIAFAGCETEEDWEKAKKQMAAVAAMSDEEVAALAGDEGGDPAPPHAEPQRHGRGDFAAALRYGSERSFKPPEAARKAAERGLAWREEHGRGGTAVGVARARDIAGGKSLSLETVGRMVSFFARHEVDKQGEGWSPGGEGYPSAGRIAWDLWGGDAGRRWAESVWREHGD